uniref:Uncharacterized protein n=1 Tax=Peronospora matthiolae TaxID=2874970 RepID=A0AAV1TTV5_9STRA
MPSFRVFVLLVSAVLLLNRACCSIPTEPVVPTSDDQAQKYTTADSVSSAPASDQVLEGRAEVSVGFFKKLVDWFKGIMAKFPQLFGLSRHPVMVEIREAPVVSGTHQVRRPEPDVQTENVVKGNFVDKLGQPSVEPGTLHVRNTDAEPHPVNNDNHITRADGAVKAASTDPSPESLPPMHKVSDWHGIMTFLELDRFIANVRSPTQKRFVPDEDYLAEGNFAYSNLSPDLYDEAFVKFGRMGDGDRDLAMYLSLRSGPGDIRLIFITLSALKSNSYVEEGKKLIVYMMQDWAARSWGPEHVKNELTEIFEANDQAVVTALDVLYNKFLGFTQQA